VARSGGEKGRKARSESWTGWLAHNASAKTPKHCVRFAVGANKRSASIQASARQGGKEGAKAVSAVRQGNPGKVPLQVR
jgi:hypothetical protein